MTDFLLMVGGALFAMFISGIINYGKSRWVGLTNEELCEIVGLSTNDSDWNVFKVQEWLRKVEAKLKEKNT
jgi:hypothetical protein